VSLLKRTFSEGLALGLSIGSCIGMLVAAAIFWVRG
jgi:hypothetical protein